jgi:hypothetical protein
MICDECGGYDVKCIEYGCVQVHVYVRPIYAYWLQGQTAIRDILRMKLISISKEYSEKQLRSN